MKSQVLHTMWCSISGEAAGEIWNWSKCFARMKLAAAIFDISKNRKLGRDVRSFFKIWSLMVILIFLIMWIFLRKRLETYQNDRRAQSIVVERNSTRAAILTSCCVQYLVDISTAHRSFRCRPWQSSLVPGRYKPKAGTCEALRRADK